LKYARFVQDNVWDVKWVDWTGQVGLYPSLTFSRTDDPIISYYHRTNGDLRMAVASGAGWARQTVDAAGDVGRFSSVALDANYPNASDVVIAYEHTSGGSFKYAAQAGGGWKTLTIDDTTTDAGGYTSLAFTTLRDRNGSFQPTVSYYDAAETSLKFASYDGVNWATSTVASAGNVGLYSNLVYDGANRANVFYYNRSANRAYRATLTPGSGWSTTLLGAGGREMSVARHSRGALAYSTLDERGPLLEVAVLPS
jgi:hypothetical protein